LNFQAGYPADQIAWAQQAASEITSTADDTPVYPATTESYNVIDKDDYNNNPSFSQYDGSGHSIVVIDTGADLDHPAFGPDINSDGVADRIVYDYDFDALDNDASDSNGHGTHVAGIVAGIATGANLIILKANSVLAIESALQWAGQNVATYNIAAINISLTTGLNLSTSTSGDLANELNFLSGIGVHAAVAAGNRYFTFNSVQGVDYPAAEPSAIAVGATYDANVGARSYPNFGGAADNTTAQDRMTSFSQRHETLLHVVAPGSRITSAYLGGTFVIFSGTSQAAPHVAAAIALAQQINMEVRGSRLSRTEIVDLIQDTGVTINDGDDENDNVVNTGLNFKRLDLDAMAAALLPPTIIDVQLNGLKPDGTSWAHGPISFAEIVPTGKHLAPIYTNRVNRISVHFSEAVRRRRDATRSHRHGVARHGQQGSRYDEDYFAVSGRPGVQLRSEYAHCHVDVCRVAGGQVPHPNRRARRGRHGRQFARRPLGERHKRHSGRF
jgi:subtilisin family serine protease